MSKGTITDAGVGRALFTTRFMLSLQAARMCLLVGALPGLILPLVIWIRHVSPHDLDLVKINLLSNVVGSSSHVKWRVRDENGARMVVTVERSDGHSVQLLTPRQVNVVLKPYSKPIAIFHIVCWISLGAAIIGYLIVWRGLGLLGSGTQENKRIRGAKTKVTANELSTAVRRRGGGRYSFIDVALPAEAPMYGILAQGAQGSGKSLTIHDLMVQVFKRKRKCFIYDHSGEFFSAYYRPGKDFFFNPALEGSVPWSIFSELMYTYDANTLSQAFLPPKGNIVSGPAAFFEDAARALFSVLLLRLTQRGARNTKDIAKAFFEMPADEMDHLIKNSVASSAVGGDSKAQRQGVISSIAIYLDGIASVKSGMWSIREFLEREDDSRFFILNTEDTKAMFAPLYRLLLTVAFDSIAAKQQIVHEDKYWFFLDEVHALGDIRLDEHLAQKRKYGVCVVSGIQSDQQFISTMGKERGQTVMNCFNTTLLLRANEPDMQERMAKRLGKLEMDTITRNQALAVTEWRDAAGLNTSEGEKWLVMPSDIGELAPLTGYLKVVGDYPACTVDYRHWLPKRPGRKCRSDRFKPIQEVPPRDPQFLISRAENEDALASVKAEVEKAKQEEKKDEKPSADQTLLAMAPAQKNDIAPVARGIDSL